MWDSIEELCDAVIKNTVLRLCTRNFLAEVICNLADDPVVATEVMLKPKRPNIKVILIVFRKFRE